MRGGLDDALDKLARRDELRRRAAGEASGTPPAVQELVEAIAAVVGRHPKMEVTVGVEGVSDPTLLHFYVEDGIVRVNADSTLASRVAEAEPASGGRHADFDLDADDATPASAAPAAFFAAAEYPTAGDHPQYAAAEFSTAAHPADEHPAAEHSAAEHSAAEHPAAEFSAGGYSATEYPASAAAPPTAEPRDAGQGTRRISYDDRDRYDPGTGYDFTEPYAPAADYGDRPHPDQSAPRRETPYADTPYSDAAYGPDAAYVHPFAATPPPPVPSRTPSRQPAPHQPAPHSAGPHQTGPHQTGPRPGSPTVPAPAAARPTVPPQTSSRPPADRPQPSSPVPPQNSRHIRPEQHHAPAEPSAAERNAARRSHDPAVPGQRGAGPRPLPEPIPLKVDSEETEQAAKRLAALLRDNPTLLRQSPPD